MDTLHALLLGILQGLTEVLPISSSGHLILVPRLLGWPESGLTFDVALHFGTLIALSVYFRRDICELISGFIGALRGKREPQNLLPLYIVAGTVPAAVAGKLFEHQIEELFRGNPTAICIFLMLFGLLLWGADRLGKKERPLAAMTLGFAMTVGLAQVLALLPGVSRSGITITAALLIGFNRESAARFSFLLSLPIVAGAAVLKLPVLFHTPMTPQEWGTFAIGISTAAISGYASVAFLLRFVQRNTLAPFVWYRLAAGIFFLITVT